MDFESSMQDIQRMGEKYRGKRTEAKSAECNENNDEEEEAGRWQCVEQPVIMGRKEREKEMHSPGGDEYKKAFKREKKNRTTRMNGQE